MKRLTIILFLFFAISLFGYAFLASASAYIANNHQEKPTPTPTQLNSEKLMSIVNNWRQSQGFQTYQANPNLCTLADERLKEIHWYFSHDGFWQRVDKKSFKFQYKDLAENLSKDQKTEESVLKDWLNSPIHKHFLASNYKYSCVKCTSANCVQIFANF